MVIEPTHGWRAVDFRELWRFRELLYLLAWRDIKVRYKQTFLGVAWVIIQPLFSMAVFTIIFGLLAKMPSDGLPYALFNFAALVPWTYFSSTLTNTVGSLTNSAHLITKVYFPRLVIPLASAITRLVDYAIALAVLIAMMFVYWCVGRSDVLPPLQLLVTIPLLTVLTTMAALGVGLWCGALNVQYRDVGHIVPFLIQLWMYATPIVWPLSLVEKEYPQYLWIFWINPMTGIIEGYRSALLGREWPWLPLGISLVASILLLVSGALYFHRVERSFADVV